MKHCLRTIAAVVAILSASKVALAFNLWTDIQQNTQWDLGSAAAGGTAINLRNGDTSLSALAEITSYRFLSTWYGGTKVNKTDANFTDTAKIGFNLSYFLAGFVHQPPEVIQRLVVGPSYAISLFSTPRVGTPFIDINYAFGPTSSLPLPPAKTLAPPPSTGLLNVRPPITLSDIQNNRG